MYPRFFLPPVTMLCSCKYVAMNHLYSTTVAEHRNIQFNVIFDSELIKLVQKNPNHYTMIQVEKPTDKKLSDLQVMSWPIWEKEISEFPWEYDTKETCYILEGEVVVTPENDNHVAFGKGDLVIFPQGMKCRWKITKAVRKHYKFG